MADIKTREVVRGTVKTIDKAAVASERLKDVAIRTKRGVADKPSADSPDVYATEKMGLGMKTTAKVSATKANSAGKKSANATRNAIHQLRREKASARTAQTNTERHVAGQVSYQNNQKLAKKRYKNAKQIKAVGGSAGNASSGALKRKKTVASYLKSIRRIASNTKTLILGLGTAGWLSAIMIAVTIFIGGTFNMIDILSVEPNQPGMDDWDKKYLEEILAEYPNGYVGPGDGNIVHVALSQVGNVGGRRYWHWYGFKSRVEWCACFVSWCANQCGYIKAGIIPKFAGVAQGVNWFQKKHRWHGRNYRPRPGDIIFFTWFPYTGISHVGIVKACDGKTVYTVEGNSHDRCREKSYSFGARCIYGYGSPAYGKAKVNKESEKEADKS